MPTPRKRILTPKVPKEAIKAKADAAAAISAGEEPKSTKAPITPEIIPHDREERARKAVAKRRRRRTKYSAPLAKAICKMLGMGLPLTRICARPLMPAESTVLGWALDPTHPFSDMYVRAREVSYYRMADEIIDIADDSRRDVGSKMTKAGDVIPVINREVIERARLRIEARKWVLAKMLPRRFGDKVDQPDDQANLGGPLAVEDRPQPVDRDHMAEITQRFARNIPGGPGKAKAGTTH